MRRAWTAPLPAVLLAALACNDAPAPGPTGTPPPPLGASGGGGGSACTPGPACVCDQRCNREPLDPPVEDCTCGDCGGTALCNPNQCLTNGVCTFEDACICPDCHADPFCSDPASCDFDSTCESFDEGCACSDCADLPPCQVDGGAGGSGATTDGGGS